MEKKVALSIAGSDSSGGAGIQADLKSFAYLDVHGVSVITCVTAQNTQHVNSIFKLPIGSIEQQLESILQDFPVAAVKTGMLYDKEIVTCVASQLREHNLKPVVDPVITATSGESLSNRSFVAALKKELLPHTFMITANAPEACILAGMKIASRKEVKLACKKIFDLGPAYVLLKGGHLQEDIVVDVLYDGKHFHQFLLPRIPNKKAHGSGCSLSALITAFLALKETPEDAVQKAKSMVWGMINEGYSPGKGADVLNHSSRIQVPPPIRTNEQFQVWLALTNAVQQLLCILPPWFIPEVGLNIVYALPNATSRDQICAIDGRITKHKGGTHLFGTIDFGVSKHIASIVLAAMAFNPMMRSALNIRYSQKTVDLCKAIGLIVGSFNRKEEPAATPSTMEWGTQQVITALGRVPDVIYDTGDVGKEPMIRILGEKPEDVLIKIQNIVSTSLA
jgi:hydroxymethylpyrimidine kinase/phosphomethylpyrimidine kinase